MMRVSYSLLLTKRNLNEAGRNHFAVIVAAGSMHSKNAIQLFLGSFSALVIVTALNLMFCSSIKNRQIARALIRSEASKMKGNNSTTNPRLAVNSADFE